MDYKKLSELLLPNITKKPEDYAALYPARQRKDDAVVTRFAPSPTGFLHIGAIYASMVGQRAAKSTDGVFYLRIEDTDKVREIENGVEEIVKGLSAFGIVADEGYQPDGSVKGEYGPYKQSERAEIYQCYVKDLIAKGLAYPCFCSEESIEQVRERQRANKERPGYYGKYAHCRELDFDTIKANVESGMPYVIRLKSPGDESRRISFNDVIKGKIEMPENDEDFVLLKRDGIPTYHFAHAVDDHLMGTTHVIRGDEWISSTPKHLQLFYLLGFKAPKYAHIAPIMKEENGSKRKLSKRKDPEAAVMYYHEQGYPKESVIEYLTTISNSNFEDWRRANKNEDISKFPFSFKKMSLSGALFDINKLIDVSKNVISAFDAEYVYDCLADWAKAYDKDFYNVISGKADYLKQFLSIGRGGKKPRKDIAKWSDVKDYAGYMFDELYQPCFDYPENISADDVKAILKSYLEVYDEGDESDVWFDKVKSICSPLGFSPDVKAYKQSPDDFKGHVGDVSTVIRIAVTGRTNTPDLCTIMKLLGRERVAERIKKHIN